MTNPYRGEASISVDGEDIPIRLDMNAMVEAETVTGISIGEIALSLTSVMTFKAGTARALLWAGIKAGGRKGYTIEAAGDLLGKIGMAAAAEKIGLALAGAFPRAKPQADSEAADPS